ncbi:hypothetical protein NM688_g6112 [Phlebia brevispora]|uniref:Uncharacterized protein n=1 Tax=Phlebia brevispora TaxID=194682 RepID=A0ACC1SJY3_9APHY|nr:hypothetical protein NM688_g6112 [Phlebia brevispora]
MDGSIVGRAKVSRAGIIGAGPRSDSPVRAAAGVAEARSITSSGFEVPSSSDHCYPAPSALSRCTPEGSSSPIPDVVVVDDWVTSGTKRRKSSSTVSAGSGPNRRTDRLMKTRSDARAKTSSRQDASQMVPGADDGARVTPPASLKTESVVLPASSALPTPASSLAKTRSKRHSHHKSKPVSVEQASFQSRKDARLVAGSVEETKSIRAWTMSTVSLVIPSPATTVPSSGGDPPAQHSVISPSWRTSSYSPSLASEFLMVEASSVGVARRKQTADALSRKSSSKSGLRESASRLLSPIAVPPVPSLKGVSDNLQDRLQDSSSPSGDLESALPWNLDRFLEVTDFRRSFGFKDFHRFSQVFRDTAASMKNSHLLSLSQASGDRARNIVRLAMYQHVMLCDDSQSLAAGDTFSTMQAVVEYIADVVTMAIPDERYDVRVRFVNSPVEMNSRSELKGGFEAVCPAGENNLGVSLRDRVLGPFVYDVLRIRNKLLERPLLVSVIIDSAPQFEQRTVFRDAVAECKARLEEARYAPTTVLFVIFVTGDTTEVKEYVDDLREDAALRDVVYFPADSLRERYYELRPNIGKFGEWVMNMLMAPVLRLEEV